LLRKNKEEKFFDNTQQWLDQLELYEDKFEKKYKKDKKLAKRRRTKLEGGNFCSVSDSEEED
jgi:hypothetical protein